MACCGKQRQSFAAGNATAGQSRGQPVATTPVRPRSSAYAYFQYTGGTGLSVRAPNSGSRYRFEGSGAVVAVDPRDRRALATVAKLRQVRRP